MDAHCGQMARRDAAPSGRATHLFTEHAPRSHLRPANTTFQVHIQGHITQLRTHLWPLKQWLTVQLRAACPSQLTYSDFVSVGSIADAWPPIASPFPTPLVLPVSREDNPVLSQHLHAISGQLTLPAVHVHAIRNGRIFPQSGLLADREGRLILESAKDTAMFKASATWRSCRTWSSRRLGQHLHTTIWGDKLASNYYHFVVDCLPRLYALAQVPHPITLVLPRALKHFHQPLIDLLCSPNISHLHVSTKSPLTCETALLTPFTTIGGVGFLRPEIVEWWRRKIAPACSAAGAPSCRRLLISRRHTAARSLTNEDELIEALRKFHFETVCTEHLSALQQVQLFHDAELIVAPHGAGLANMLFCRRASVVELQAVSASTSARPRAYFAGLAQSLDFPYLAVLHCDDSSSGAFRANVPAVVEAVDVLLHKGSLHPYS